MRTFSLIVILFILLLRVTKWYYYGNVRIEVPQPPSEEPGIPMRPRDGVDFLAMATNAFMNRGKTREEVTLMLKEAGLQENAIETAVDTAFDIYQDWLQKKSPEELEAYREKMRKLNEPLPSQQADVVHPGISLSVNPANSSSAGLQATIGNAFNTRAGKDMLWTMAAFARAQAPVKSDDNVSIGEASFADFGGSTENPFINIVSIKGERATIFPYLKTDKVLSFDTKVIAEWDGGKDYNIEADIEGELEGGNVIGFYATDYAVNKFRYKSTPKLNIRMAAFASSVTLWSGLNSKVIDKNYVGYFPRSEYEGLSYFDFVGRILKVKGMPLSETNLGCVLTLQLLNSNNGNEPVIIDVFVNNDNIKTNQIKKDMTVEGLLWFQAEIA